MNSRFTRKNHSIDSLAALLLFANFRKNLEVGQEVITAGGIYGKIKEIEDSTVVLEVASGVKIKIDRNSIYANAAANQQTK